MRYRRRSLIGTPPYFSRSGTMDIGMIEILFMAQAMRNPLQAIARRWWCRSLFRASRGQRRCTGCTKS